MILPGMKAMRFFRLFDELSIYAHVHLHVVADDEFWTGEPPRGISDKGQRETMRELWTQKELIDRFVRENPQLLPASELSIASSWKHAYHSLFYVDADEQGRIWLFAEDYAFGVTGMTLEIGEMLGHLPCMVETTLLPYGSYVVYDQGLLQMPISLGEGPRKLFSDGLREALESSRTITTGEQLITIAGTLEQKRADRAVEEFHRELEMEERAAGPHEGQRASVLCGLDEEAREEAISAHGRELDLKAQQEGKPSFLSVLDAQCMPESFTTSLAELLHDEDLPTQKEILEHLESMEEEDPERYDLPLEEGLPGLAAFLTQQKERARTLTAEEYVLDWYTTKEGVRAALAGMNLRQLRGLHRLVDHNGMLRFTAEGITREQQLPTPELGICYLFREESLEGCIYTYVVPDEVLPLLKEVDWNLNEQRARTDEHVIHFFEDILELRGIVEYAQAMVEYLEAYPNDGLSILDAHDILMDACKKDRCDVCALATGEKTYLLHYEAMAQYLMGKGREPYGSNVVEKGKLDDLLKGLLAQQEGKEARKLTDEMLAERSLFDWKLKQPPARAMRDFFDAHVPDARDEYFFADRVMEELLEEAQWGMAQGRAQAFSDILEHNDFLPDESQLGQLLTLWQNLCNGLPTWPNNGWSPNELMSRSTGRRVFYNPDGSPMRVGRNDPCPCGSGKKYKRCCGR